MSVANDVRDIFGKLPAKFVPEKAAGVNASIQFALNGDGGGNWLLKIADGRLDVVQGETPAPDLRVEMKASDYIALSRKEVSPMSLFMTGRIKVEGDMSLIMKFQDMFSSDQA